MPLTIENGTLKVPYEDLKAWLQEKGEQYVGQPIYAKDCPLHRFYGEVLHKYVEFIGYDYAICGDITYPFGEYSLDNWVTIF